MTADEDTLKKLPIGGILKASWQYFLRQRKNDVGVYAD